jgi:anti-anti-sigma factor
VEAIVLEINIEENEDYTLIQPSGELDAYTVGTFRESLARLAEQGDLLIDLSQVSFMDSAGLGALIGGIRLSREAENAVAVACNKPQLVRLLHTTGFDRIVPVSDSMEEAEDALLAPHED